MQPIYVAAYHQSAFGKLFAIDVPDLVQRAVLGVCREIGVTPDAIDVGTVGAACNLSLNAQGLASGLMAGVAGLEGKPLEAVENACASGGQAVLAVIHKLLVGAGEVGIALGFEKMRGPDGKVDGRRIGEVLGSFSHPEDRTGKVYVFPHLFAEVMAEYLARHGASEADLAAIAVEEYANANRNPYAQMRDVALDLRTALEIEGVNRYIVPGLPLKTYDCSQITDGYAALLLATGEGLRRLGLDASQCVRVAGWGQATDPLRKAGRDCLRAEGARRAMIAAYGMAGRKPADVNVAEVHDCFTVMGAIGAEVLGKADYGQGWRYWRDGRARIDGECAINSSGGLIAKGHPIGATGIAMIGWCAWQLTERAPAGLQVEDPRVAATFNVGGPLCASVCTVLEPPA